VSEQTPPAQQPSGGDAPSLDELRERVRQLNKQVNEHLKKLGELGKGAK
jgi:hypothetical protein